MNAQSLNTLNFWAKETLPILTQLDTIPYKNLEQR